MNTPPRSFDLSVLKEILIPGNLICIAGRPGTGKSTLLQQLEQKSKDDGNYDVILISPENPKNDFDNAPYISAETIRQHLVEIMAERNISLVLIDNLQLLDDVEGDKSEGLKRMALDLNLPVVVTCHALRTADVRPDRRPKLDDLADDTIKNFADVVVLLHELGGIRKMQLVDQ